MIWATADFSTVPKCFKTVRNPQHWTFGASDTLLAE